MDDKELPGFKINDYSGESDSDVAEDTGGVAENGSVTHGEGDFKPVMVENGQVGGSEKTALKMAPEGAEEQFEGVGGVSDGSNGDTELGKPAQITEAEARAMLIEDNARAKEALKKADTRGKKTLVAVIALAVLLVVAGVATSIILGGMRDDAENDKQEGNSGAVEEPAVTELSLDDELVQALYGQFEISPLQGFYNDELLTAEVFDSNPERGRLEMALNQAENWTAAAVRAKYQEMFGEEVVLTGEKYGEATLAEGARWLWTTKGAAYYNEEQDEFLELEGGTDGGGRYIRRLERAEKEGDKVYLYERALTINCRPDPRFDEEGNQIGGGSSCGILTVAATCGTPEFGWSGDEEGMTDEEILSEAAGRGLGLVKWTFRLVDGRYVYRGMERVMGDGSGVETEDLNEERNENE